MYIYVQLYKRLKILIKNNIDEYIYRERISRTIIKFVNYPVTSEN